MKNLPILAARGIANTLMLGIAATTTGMLMACSPANAANLSLTGNLADANDIASFFFTADGTSTVTIRSYSWGGGTNAQGTTIAPGGFDPVLTLFNSTNGNYILDRDDISSTPLNLDFQLSQVLAAGNYRAVLSASGNYANGAFPGGNFSDGFTGGTDFFGRTSAYAFDILNVNNTTPTAVPEPSSLIGTAVAGFTVVMFRRKLSSKKK
jgi:hypothetical protein